MTVAEETAIMRARSGFSVKRLADYLEVHPRTVRATMRHLRMPRVSLLTRVQAAKVMMHIRAKQGEQILKDSEPRRKVTFLG